MNVKTIVVGIIYVCLALVGMTLIKMGGQDKTNGVAFGGIIIGVKTILGVLFYGLSFLIYTFVISQMQISLILPILSALNSLGIVVIGRTVFNEQLNVGQFIGVGILLLGIILIGVYTK